MKLKLIDSSGWTLITSWFGTNPWTPALWKNGTGTSLNWITTSVCRMGSRFPVALN